jgi:predicted phosphodiesterase
MRLAVISDIHGNDIALERVLGAIQADGADQIVCLGDVAGTGPQPRAATERLRSTGAGTVMGNGTGPQPRAATERLRSTGAGTVMGNVDWYLLHPDSVTDPADEAMARFWDIDKWCIEQLTTADLAYMAGFEPTIEVAIGPGLSVLCYHGSPASFEDPITPTTPDDHLDEWLAGRDSTLFLGGHTHFAMVRRFGSALVVNPGSVGMAYDRTRPPEEIRLAPWAEYALVTVRNGTLSIDLRRVEYDKSLVAEAVRSSGMPHADWLADEWAR